MRAFPESGVDFLEDMRQLFSVSIINSRVHGDYVLGLLSNESLINDAYVRLVMHRHGGESEKLYVLPRQYR